MSKSSTDAGSDSSSPVGPVIPSAIPQAILVGEVVKAHGIRGEVAVWTLSENPQRFQAGARLLVGGDLTSAVGMAVESCRAQPPDRLLVRFEGIFDRTQAEALRGARIFAAPRDLPPLPEDLFWEQDLLGLDVVDLAGQHLGEVSAVLSRAEQDLWQVKTAHGPVLLPAAKGIVVSVDLPNRRLTVDPPAGLF
ncbi:MAG: ribosome maturation factor RimM [Actinomycetota bacterium]